ncbi:hypothetical protein JCM10450v2_003763 [Rhodotorula kratochvilovae]
MADPSELYRQLFGAGDPAAAQFDTAAFDFHLPAPSIANGAGADLAAVDPLASHSREHSDSTASSASGDQQGTVAPADLSPPAGGRSTASSSRRASDEHRPSLSAAVDKGAGSAKKGGAAGGKKQKKAGSEEEGADEGAATGKKVKKTRNRKPSSCAQCRKKKLRCNRADPCAPCVARGEGHLCSWEGAEPLYKARDEADNQELRDQVARLESLVRYLTSQRPDEPPTGSPTVTYDEGGSPGGQSVDNFPSKARGSDPFVSRGSFGAHDAQTPKTSFALDMRANDLAEGLAQLAIKEFVVLEGSGSDAWAPGNARGLEFLDEAKEFVETMPQQFGVSRNPAFALPAISTRVPSGLAGLASHSTSGASEASSSPANSMYTAPSPLSPGGLSTAAFTKEAPPLSEALKYLPTHKQAMSAYRYFSGYVSWYAHPVHLASFEQQWAQLRAALALENEEERARAVDPFFIATFLGILATGLAMMPAKRAIRDGFGADKDKIVDSWLEGAMVALTCGRFLDNPSVEAVRATVVLGTFFVFVSTGERSGAGMGLLSLVVQIALSLGLHRDPDRSPGKFTFFEAEERRRLFWNLFMLCILSSASLSRTWAVFDLNGVDTKLPLDCTDDEILDEAAAMAGIEKRKMRFEETPMTSLIVKMKLAVLARKMNDRAFGIHPVPYEEILALDAELREFEESIPSRYQLRLDPSGALSRPTTHVTVTEMRACMVQISLAGEFLRVHRPWMLLAGSDKRYQYSRNQAIKYAKLLLAVYRSPSCNGQKWGGLSYKATNAAIVLAVDILAHPDGSEVSQLRSIVNAVCKQMEAQAGVSSLCRKGVRVLKFLLEKEALLSTQRDQRRQNKRVRTDDAGGVSFPSRQLRTALDPAYVAPSPLQFMHDRGEEDLLVHKSDFGGSPADYAAAAPAVDYAASTSAFRPPPLPLPRQPRAAPAPPPTAAPSGPMSIGDMASFADLGNAFEFDFRLPPAGPYASPAPTTYSYSSPYPHPPHYGQPPQPPLYSSHPATPGYPLPSVPAAAPYPPAPLDQKAAAYATGAQVPPSAGYALPRY